LTIEKPNYLENDEMSFNPADEVIARTPTPMEEANHGRGDIHTESGHTCVEKRGNMATPPPSGWPKEV